MSSPIQILSTDFDGTVHTEHDDPPVPRRLAELIAGLQASGTAWVINTGRDLSSLMETLGRAHLPVWPDYVVTVEREIHAREHGQYIGLADWNDACSAAHRTLFHRVRRDVPKLMEWITARFDATLYEDAWSPFCLIAQSNGDADEILQHLETYCTGIPELTVVRNDVYARFSHEAFNKGSALAEIARRRGVTADRIVAAGDHLNDLPMLLRRHARWLIAPGNAIPQVKKTVLAQEGFVAKALYGHGVVEGLEEILRA